MDRNRHGGGVLAYIHNSLTWDIVLKGFNGLELIAFSIKSPLNASHHCVTILYRPPSSPVSFFDTFYNALCKISPAHYISFVLVGDFNVDYFCKDHPYFCKFQSIFHTLSLSQVVQSPTHATLNGDTTLIDWAVLSNVELLSECSIIPPLSNADHNGIYLHLKWKQSAEHVEQQPRTVWRYSFADFERACELIDDTDWVSLLPQDDIDTAAVNWHTRFLEIMHLCIPQQTLRKKKNLPWITKSILNLMKKRNAAFKVAKRSHDPRAAAKYRHLRNKVIKVMREARKDYLQKLNPLNTRQFWKTIKYLKKEQSTLPTLQHEHAFAESNQEKANMLNQYFSMCFNKAVPPLSSSGSSHFPLTECSDDLLCSEDEILNDIISLDVNKASGPDGISPIMLKRTAHSIAPSLTALFNISIRLGQFPELWKTSSVVPIPKSSSHKEASNYRPISLLSLLSKLIERHFHRLISDHLTEARQLSNNQWGFQARKSTTTALLSVVNEWHQILEHGGDIGAIFFDIKKAFDSVPHQPLLDKLCRYELDSHIISWVRSYLTERQQHVRVSGYASSNVPVLSGVPQGSVLGPLLFLIYVDDVFLTHLSTGSTLILFADDMLLYKPVKCCEDYHHLQEDVNSIYDWTCLNNFTLNSTKCKFMQITRRKTTTQSPQLHLNDRPIERVFEYKYLGVVISSDLTWASHINTICTRAKKVIGLLYRQFFNHTSSQTQLKLYKALVRPHLEYAAQVWDPYMTKDVSKLENVQKFALKVCLNGWNLSYHQLEDRSNLPMLQNRRQYLKLCTLYKLFHGLYNFPPHVLSSSTSRRNNHTCLSIPFARTTSYKASFFPSTIPLWNNLPSDAHLSPSLFYFKHHIEALFL